MVSFRSAQGERQVGFSFQDIDLSIARNKQRLGISGNFMYIPSQAFDGEESVSTSKSTGVAFARVSRLNADPIILVGGQLYQLEPFDEIYLTNEAQPDKMLRIYFSVNQIIEPAAGTISNVQQVSNNPGLEDLLKNGEKYERPVTDLRGYGNRARINGGGSHLVQAGNNPNGIYVQWLQINASGGTFNIKNGSGGNIWFEWSNYSEAVRDFILPGGEPWLFNAGSNANARIWYTLL